ncbi:MAG TPA: GtrA family protein, partial [Pirellulales bacterium]
MAPAAANIARRPQEAKPATDLPLLVQIVRYLIVGGVAFVADVGTLFVLTDLCHWYYLQSAAVAFLIGMAINYLLSIAWVFKVRAVKNPHVEFLLFASIGLAGLGVNQLMLWALADGLDLFYLHAKLITAVAVLGWNFAARKLLLFTSPGSASSQ